MAVFSTGERKRRPRGDRKSQEMSIHLRQTFEAAIKTELYPRSQIDIFVEVLQGMYGLSGKIPSGGVTDYLGRSQCISLYRICM